MTWLELLNELRKQPLNILEKEAVVWNRIEINDQIATLIGRPEELVDNGAYGQDDIEDLALNCYYDTPREFFDELRDFGVCGMC